MTADGPPTRKIFLVGRDRELLQLQSAAREAAAGHGGLALVTGEPGIGKTTLVRALAEVADSEGIRPLWSACWDGDGVPVFWPWVQLLRAYVERLAPDHLAGAPNEVIDEVARLVPELGRDGRIVGVPDGSARFRLFDAITTFICRAAEVQPLLLVLDDLQWADPSSLHLLAFAAPQLTLSRVAVVGTYREDEVDADSERRPLLQDLLRGSVRVPLAGLDTGGVAQLVAEATGEAPDDAGARQWRERTGGNPFLVWESSRLLAAEGAPGGLPPGVTGLIARRLAQLSPACRDLLGVAALRPQVDLRVLADVTDISPSALLELVDEAVHARLLVPPTSSLGEHGFEHALLRDALLATVSSSRRLGLHARYADALEGRRAAGGEVHLAEIAHHLLNALGADGVEPRRAAVFAMEAAREAAAALAFGEAAALAERSVLTLEVAGAGDSELLEALLELAEARRRAGDSAAATQAFLRASDLARSESSAHGLAESALGLHRLGVISGTGEAQPTVLLSEALAALGPGDAEHRALVLASLVRAQYHLHLADGVELRALAEEAVALARGLDDRRTLAFCLLALHDAVWAPGNSAERQSIAQEMAGVASGVDTELEVEAHLVRATALLELGDPRADQELARFQHLAAGTRQPRFEYLGAARRAMDLIRRGRLDEGDRASQDAERLGTEVGEPDVRNVRFCQLWELRSQQGRRRELLERAIPYQATTWASGWPGAATVLILLDCGDELGAGAAYGPFESLDPHAIPAHYGWMPTVALVAEAAVAMGDTDSAVRTYDALLPHADSHVVIGGAVAYVGAVSHRLGMLAAALGRPERARAHFERAVTLHLRSAAPAWAVRARAALATVLVESGDAHERDRGTELLQTAAAEARRLGVVLPPGGHSATAPLQGNRFQCDHGIWEVAYAGKEVRIKDMKGLRDIAALLAVAGRDVHVLDLVAGPASREKVALLGADAVLDERARRAYSERIALLDREAAMPNRQRADRAREERTTLLRELSAASGLGGRARQLDNPAERARKTVGARIRDALGRLSAVHPELADHLGRAITLGTFCSYSPDAPTRWQL